MTSDYSPKPEQRGDEENDLVFPQVAIVPFRRCSEGFEILLITNNSGKRWILPKGLVEEHLSTAESGAAEAYEEAGIRGTILTGSLGEYRYRKWGGICSVEVFLMRVECELQDWPEAFLRRRRWVSIREARRILDTRVPLRILDAAAKRIQPRQLEDLPNIGKSIAADLRCIGIVRPDQLAEREPIDVFHELSETMGRRHDPCVLYTLLSVRHFLDSDESLPWWRFTDEGRKILQLEKEGDRSGKRA